MSNETAWCPGSSLAKNRRTAGRLRRAAVLAGVVGLTAGAAVMTAGSALAANGSQPGNLTLSPASGPTTTQATWSTSTGCPVNFQGAAVVDQFNTDGSLNGRISAVINGSAAAITNAPMLDTVGNLLANGNITNGGTVEWAVACYSGTGGTGNFQYVQSTFVTLNGTNYSTSATGPVQTATTTTLSANPNPATTGATVTLTATEVAADSTHPAGNVQFEVGGTNIGAPVAVNASGVATTTTTAQATPGTENLSAVFTPTPTTYTGSTGTTSLSVQQAGSLPATGSPVPITVTVPASGTLSVTVVNSAVPLAINAAGTQATGTLGNVTVADSRNNYPGWAVSGQQSAFTGSGTASGFSISGNQEGWTPAFVSPAVDGAVIGSPVSPVTPGLGSTPATLGFAAAGCGFGTNVMNAALTLDIPTGQAAGSYAGSMTITYIETQPSGVAGCVPITVGF